MELDCSTIYDEAVLGILKATSHLQHLILHKSMLPDNIMKELSVSSESMAAPPILPRLTTIALRGRDIYRNDAVTPLSRVEVTEVWYRSTGAEPDTDLILERLDILEEAGLTLNACNKGIDLLNKIPKMYPPMVT